MRTISEIETRLFDAEQERANCAKWYESAYKKYQDDRKAFGIGADNGEYLYAAEQLSSINLEISVLNWILEKEETTFKIAN